MKKEVITDKTTDVEQLDKMLKEINEKTVPFHYSFSNRDPMKPPFGKKSILAKMEETIGKSEVIFPSLVLKGIVFVENQSPVAIINEEIVRENSEIEGGKVINIEKNKVFIEWKGERKWIFLNPQAM